MENGMINHVFCTCGGVIQVNKRIPNFYCQKCNREYKWEEIRYDRLLCNIMTGWIFPVIEDGQMLKSIVNRLEQMKEKQND